MTDPELHKTLEANKKLWNDQMVAIAEHMCIQMGHNPDDLKISVPHLWDAYLIDASEYLKRRTMNKFYWEHLCGQEYDKKYDNINKTP